MGVGRPPADSTSGATTRMWADDFHHALHVAAHRRARGLLRELRHRWTGSCASSPAAPGALRRLRAEPRPGRQSRGRRSPAARRAPGRARGRALLALRRRSLFMGEEYDETRAVPVLHRPHRPVHRRRDARGPRAEFAKFTAFSGEDVPDPQDARDVRAVEARRERAIPIRSTRELLAPPPRAAARGSTVAAEGRGPDATPRRRRRSSRTWTRVTVELRRVTAALWPGRPFPLGATWDGDGTNFALFSEHAERVELCLFDDAATRSGMSSRSARPSTGTLPAGRRPRSALRLPRPRPLRARARPPVQPVEAPDRPVREGGRRPGPVGRGEHAAVRAAGDADADLVRDDEDDAARSRSPSSSTRRSTGRTTTSSGRDALARDRHLRVAREGIHAAPRGRSRGPARHLRRPRLASRRDRVPHLARRHRGRAPPGAPHRRRGLPQRSRAHELLGLLDDRLPRAALALRGDGRRPGARVQGHGEGAPPCRDRGDPRRRLQPHRRGQPPRADAQLPRRRQHRATTASCRTTRGTTWTTPGPATP